MSDVAFQKWLKPTSYSVAAEAKLAIWPPTFVCLFARSTIAIAFQRTYDRMRCSISWSPGMRTCWSVGIVLMYAVFAENGR